MSVLRGALIGLAWGLGVGTVLLAAYAIAWVTEERS